MTIQEVCRNVEDLLRDDKGGTNFSPAARYAVRMLLDYAERAAALEASGQDKDARITEQEKMIAERLPGGCTGAAAQRGIRNELP